MTDTDDGWRPGAPGFPAPHVPASFINAIAEEGTKAEAIEYLQKTWNENCALRAQLAKRSSDRYPMTIDIVERMKNYIHGEHDEYIPEVLQLACAEIERLRTAAASPPEGWVLVPREPTAEMIDAGDELCPVARGTESHAMAGGVVPEDYWRVMVAAALSVPRPNREDRT